MLAPRMTEVSIELLSASGANESIREAVNAGRASVGLAPSSAELWRWRAASPDGTTLGVARRGDGSVAAAILGVHRKTWLVGEAVRFTEVVELYNDFTGGRGLARTRPLLELAAAYAREVGGPGPGCAPVLYGVPTRRAHRIGLARFKQEILRSENVLAVQPSSVEWHPQGVDVEEVTRLPDELAGLFERYAEARPAILARDPERLDWRYAQHPEHSYRIAVARRAGELAGYLVLRTGVYADQTGGILVDWLVPPDAPDVGMELLIWASEQTAEHDRLLVNVSDRSPEFGLFQAVGFRVFGTHEYLVFRSFQKPYVMSWLFSNWTTTLGDTERG